MNYIGKDSTYRLKEKVAVVTGASGNLGPIWLKTLRAAGARVYALALPGTENHSTLRPFLDDPLISIIGADVTNQESLKQAAEIIYSQEQAIDVVVANAGIDSAPIKSSEENLSDKLENDFEDVLKVNIFGVYQTLEIFSEYMRRNKRGSIIIIGSVYSLVSPDPSFYNHMLPTFTKPPAYGASKAALTQLAKYYAVHWGKDNIRVNVLSPGGILSLQDIEFITKYSKRVPLNRMALPSDLSGPLVFLASEEAKYITGINLVVDGGFTAL